MAGDVFTILLFVVLAAVQGHFDTQYSSTTCASWGLRCFCKDESVYTNGQYLLLVDCTNTELQEVPTGIPNITTVLTLNGNKISDLSEGLFKNLILLKYLDLSNNVLQNLAPGVFQGLVNLQTLELNQNEIRYNNVSIPETVFVSLRNLKRLNLQQSFASYDVSDDEDYPVESLLSLHNLEQLLLDGLKEKNFAAKFLVLNATKLQRIIMSGFEGRCNLSRITPGMFHFSRHLTTIKIENCHVKTVENGSFLELTFLRKLDLSYNEDLQFKSLANISFGLQNRYLYELRLIKIHEVHGDCTRIEKKDLIHAQFMNVQHLYLDSNRLAYISEDAVLFVPKNVSILSLRDNMLLIGNYIKYFYVIPSVSSIVCLDIAGQTLYRDVQNFHRNDFLSANISNNVIKRFSEKGTNIKSNLQLSKRDTNDVKHKSKRYNVNTNVTEKIKPYLNKINKTSAEQNENAPYISGKIKKTSIIQLEMISNERLPKMSNESLIENKTRNDTKTITDDNKCFKIGKQLLAMDLSSLNLRFEVKPFCIETPNNLMRVNLQNNVLWNWQGPVQGFVSLLNLNLAWNSCGQMSLDFFHTMPGLLTLNVSRNFLNPFISNDIDGQIFEKHKHLKRLDLSDNKLTSLPPKIFKNLISLEDLYLSDNFLTTFDVVLNSVNLFYIDIGHNRISSISESTTDIVSRIAAANGDMTIDLSNNSLSCSCSDTKFVKWVANTIERKLLVTFINFQDYQCKYKNDNLVNLSNANYFFPKLQRECANYLELILVLSILAFMVFVGFLSCMMYRYRWNLRYFYYSAKLRMQGYKPLSVNDETNDTFEYDVFVSYSSDDGRFVKNNLLPEMEEKRQLRVLVHDRDFWAGDFVNDNIMRAITTSRKTLILLSNHFLQSHWCVYEMNMARMEGIKTGRDVLCVIMLEPVNVKGLPLEIMDIIRNQTYIEWKNDDDYQDLFWDRVDQAIRH